MSTAFEISHDWEEPEDLHALLQTLRQQRHDANVRMIRYAYFVAENAHKGQSRASGEPYIQHPIAVARILVDLQVDDETIVAALLHDVLEDSTLYSREFIENTFGESVRHLVEGVTKLKFKPIVGESDRQRAAAETHRTAETLRKMLLAMAKDFRVMVIKLADRLHNMQTLDALPEHKQIRIATETLDVYAPLAARLGIWQMKWQLEDLAFKALHPAEFQRVTDLVAKSRSQREAELEEAIVTLKDHFEARGLKIADIKGRPKHLFSIFNKMTKQGVRFEEVYDLLALRIIVESLNDCYVALGVVHAAFAHMPALFYDYIGRPKPNGYQSIHTKVVGPRGQTLEVQIRSREMHRVAEHGVAAHWTYKEGRGSIDETSRLSILRQQLLEWSDAEHSGNEFLRNVSTDLFSEQVFVFTPKGDVLDLPKDSTAVDFAFRIHTRLGLTLVGARVNGMLVPLPTKLQNGDVVELINRSNGTPSLHWLEFVKSAHARSKIKNHFRRLTRDEDAQRGREQLEREFKSLGIEARQYLGDDKLDKLAEQMEGCERGIDVLAKVGAGLTSAQSVVSKLRGQTPPAPPPRQIEVSRSREGKPTLITSGVSNVLINRAKCCAPIPGDDVVGYITRGRGVMIHRKSCPNVDNYLLTEPERVQDYAWPPDGQAYAVPLRLTCVDRAGLLMDVSTVFGESKTNVVSVRVKTLPNQTAEIDFTIEVRDTDHLDIVSDKIKNFPDVMALTRLLGRSK